MKIIHDPRSLQVQGALAVNKSTIVVNAHMMKVMSALYSDIPWAVVREYGTNMVDGHLQLPKGAPQRTARIHLPNPLEPWIEFKDYGCGMDADTAMFVYKDYGASTKSTDNNQVGGFGLGAKVAHAYVGSDQWTVESRYNGEKLYFVSTKDEHQVPTFYLLKREATDEPNGVTVRVPVRPQDFLSFRKAVERLYEYYPFDLEVVGDPGFKAKKPNYVLQGERWGLREPGMDSGPRVIMGNVPYPIDVRQLYGQYAYGEMFQSLAIDLHLEIGEVPIVPSREALAYEDVTIKTLKEAERWVKEGLNTEVSKALAKCTTEWEVLAQFHTGGYERIAKFVKSLLWRGRKIDPTIALEMGLAQLRAAQPKDPAGIDLDDPKQLATWTPKIFQQAMRRGRSRARAAVSLESVDQMGIHPQYSPQVYYNDLSDQRKGKTRFRTHLATWLRSDTRAQYYLIEGGGLTTDAVSSLLGGFPVDAVSDLTQVPEELPKARAKGITAPVQLREWSVYGERKWSKITLTPEQVKEGRTFVRLQDEGPFEFNEKQLNFSRIEYLARSCGFLDEGAIVGIPRTLKRLEREAKWVDFLPWITKQVEKKLKKVAQPLADYHAWEDALPSPVMTLLHHQTFKKLPASSDVRQFHDRLHAVKRGFEHLDLEQLAELLGVTVKLPKPTDKPEPLLKALTKKHPLLPILARLGTRILSDAELKVMVNYFRASADPAAEDDPEAESALTLVA